MPVSIRKALTSEVKPLIGLHSESGGGKTRSALELALGFAGSMEKVCMIETESGRGEAWANDKTLGGYMVASLRENFGPKQYGEAISAAERAGMQALIIDSASHEWEGVGGVLSMAADNQAAGKKGPLVWQQPKMQHAREFVLRLTQTPIPLVIVCMRSKYVMQEVDAKFLNKWQAENPGKKAPKLGDWARDVDLSPKQSEDMLFEMFVHGWLDRERHAFHGTKYTLDALRQVIIDNEPITKETGQRLRAWCIAQSTSAPPPPAAGPGVGEATSPKAEGGAEPTITREQAANIETLALDNKISTKALAKAAGAEFVMQIPASQYQLTLDRIAAMVKRRTEARDET